MEDKMEKIIMKKIATKVIKRSGAEVPFNGKKIYNAIFSAFMDTKETLSANEVAKITAKVIKQIEGRETIGIEEIQDLVVKALMESKYTQTGIEYMRYRDRRSMLREKKHDMLEDATEIFKETDKLNANISNGPMGKMLQLGGIIAKEFMLKNVFSAEFSNAHRNGIFHIHDLDFSGLTVNCLQIPAEDCLKNGFDNGHGYIRPPKRIQSAASLAAILIQSSQNDMFGGQSIPNFDTALSHFVFNATDDEVFQAMEALIFNLNSMHSRAGAQVPFSSLNIGLDTSENARRITKALLLAYEKGLGKGENPIFPNIIFKVKKGVNRFPSDANYDLFKLAMRVASKRMNPTFAFMDTTFNSPYESVDYMGCRTRTVSNVNGPEVTVRRGNLFFTTLNLPRIGIEANHDIKKFYEILDERMDLCVRQLKERYEVVSKLKVKDLPFVMGQGLYMGSENLKPEDSIEPAIRNGSLAMGFIGLAETLVALIGKHHGESEEAEKLGLEIISHMKDYMDEQTRKTHLNFALFATPAEGLSGRFTKMDQKQFGVIKGVTDREYYTNSFHVPVYFKITHYKKIAIEGKFHKYCLGGHISYVEFDAPPIANQLAVEKELNHMADSDIGYAGINFPIDYCNECGYQGVINEDDCPCCGAKKSIRRIRRITGYLSNLDNFNTAKAAEVRDRTTN